MTTSTTDSRSVSSSIAYLERLARGSVARARGEALQTMSSTATAERPVLRSVDYLEQLARSSESNAAVEPTPEPDPAKPQKPRLRRRPEFLVLAAICFAAYLAAAIWMRYGLDFVIGDAAARSAEAKYVIMSRDAHAAALGFYWMPLPTISQLPLLLGLAPFGQAEFAGPLSTVFWGTGTLLVLSRMCLDLRLPRLTGVLLVAAYALNPVVVYYAGNGMGEGALIFFVALALSGTLSYTSQATDGALVRVAVGLAGAVMSRYEAVPLLFVLPPLVGLADLQRRSRARAALTTALAGLPAAWCLLLWVFYMKSIGGSYTAFRTNSEATTGTAPGAPQEVFRPDYFDNATGSLGNALEWTSYWLLLYGPALVILPLLLLPLGRRSIGTLAILGTMVTLPAVTFYLLVKSETTGEPRYFTSFLVLACVAAIWTAARLQVWQGPGHIVLRLLAAPVLTALLVLGAVTGSYALTDGDLTHYNSESRVFGEALDVPDGNPRYASAIPPWREFSDRLDRELPGGKFVLADTRYSFWAALLSSKTDQFVMNSDRDYQQQVAPTGVQRFDYAIVPVSGSREGLADAYDDAGRVVREDRDAWVEVMSVPGAATLWKRITPLGSSGVTSRA